MTGKMDNNQTGNTLYNGIADIIAVHIYGDITTWEARKIERLYRSLIKIERGIAKRGVKK